MIIKSNLFLYFCIFTDYKLPADMQYINYRPCITNTIITNESMYDVESILNKEFIKKIEQEMRKNEVR